MAAKRAGGKVSKPEVAERGPEEAEEVKKEVPFGKRMTYREFFAYQHPRTGGSPQERVGKIGRMWREYQGAGK